MSDERPRSATGRASGRYASVPVDSVPVNVQLDAPTKKAVLSNVVDCVFTIIVMGFGVAIIQGVATATNLGWIDKGSLTFALSLSCPCIIMAQFISPAAVVVRAVSTMDAENLPTQVFQSQAVCNVLGISYAVQIHNFAVLSANMVGLSAQLVYLACATYIKDEDARWVFWFVRMAAILNSALYVFILVSPIRILGHLITVFNVVLFASPLTKVAQILRTRSADSLPLAMTCIGFLSNGVWTLYSMMIEDMVVLLPSLLGFLLSSFQVLLIAWCRDLLPFDLAFLAMLVGPESPDAVELTPRAAREDIVEEDEGSPLVASMESGFGVPLDDVAPVHDVPVHDVSPVEDVEPPKDAPPPDGAPPDVALPDVAMAISPPRQLSSEPEGEISPSKNSPRRAENHGECHAFLLASTGSLTKQDAPPPSMLGRPELGPLPAG